MIFNDAKIAQMAAFFLQRRGGSMSYLKLLKLLYLADRESYARWNEPMSGDSAYSLKNGPVLSNTYNLIGGQEVSASWDRWIQSERDYEVSLKLHPEDFDESLDELSQADLNVLDDIWRRFGHLTRWQLVDYTHANCAEWQDPDGGAIPIKPQTILMALGRSEEEAEMLTHRIMAQRHLDMVLSKY